MTLRFATRDMTLRVLGVATIAGTAILVASGTTVLLDAQVSTSGTLGPPAPLTQHDPEAAKLEFEAVSVKRCESLPPTASAGGRGGGSGSSFQMTPGRTRAVCMTAATLIRAAYGLPASDFETARSDRFEFNSIYRLGNENGRRVRGGPDWVRTERYTIEAVAKGSVEARTMSGPMLRALLERRFQLAAHVETEQTSAFALTVAKGGLKLKPVDADACTPPPESGARDVIDRLRRGEKPFCGLIIVPDGPTQVVVAGASPLPPFLGEILGVRVIDQTGIANTTRFNYVLEYSLDENTAGPLGRRGGRFAAEPSEASRGPDIFSALTRLGLNLKPAQARSEYIVIDRIERPSEN